MYVCTCWFVVAGFMRLQADFCGYSAVVPETKRSGVKAGLYCFADLPSPYI